MTHVLKTWPVYYREIAVGNKNFELRKDDRGFNVGDFLHLKEYDPATNEYTGSELKRKITYILRNAPEFGLIPGYCVMSFN